MEGRKKIFTNPAESCTWYPTESCTRSSALQDFANLAHNRKAFVEELVRDTRWSSGLWNLLQEIFNTSCAMILAKQRQSKKEQKTANIFWRFWQERQWRVNHCLLDEEHPSVECFFRPWRIMSCFLRQLYFLLWRHVQFVMHYFFFNFIDTGMLTLAKTKKRISQSLINR